MKNTVLKQFFDNINTEIGSMICSFICGMGLSMIFKFNCQKNCISYLAPHPDDFIDKQFKIEGKCFVYTPYIVDCNQDDVLLPYNSNDNVENQL